MKEISGSFGPETVFLGFGFLFILLLIIDEAIYEYEKDARENLANKLKKKEEKLNQKEDQLKKIEEQFRTAS